MELIDISLAIKLATKEQRLKIKIEDRIVESETYGKYVSSFIGIVDLFSIDYETWIAMHPQNNNAGSYSVVCSDYIDRVETEDPMQNGRYAMIWIALDFANKDWKNNNPDCKYLKDVPKAKKFPVGWTDKRLEKYMNKFSKYMLRVE